MFKAAPIETTIITAVAALKFTGLGAVLANAMLTSIKTSAALKFKSLANLVGEKIRLALLGISIKLPSIALDLSSVAPTFMGTAGFDVIGNKIIDGVDEFIRNNFGDKVSDAMGEALILAMGAGGGFLAGGPIGAAIGGALTGIVLEVARGGTWVGEFWNQLGQSIFNWDVAGELAKCAKEFFRLADEAFQEYDFASFGINMVEGIINGIAAGAAWVIEPIMDLFDAIVKAICDIFGIHSPRDRLPCPS